MGGIPGRPNPALLQAAEGVQHQGVQGGALCARRPGVCRRQRRDRAAVLHLRLRVARHHQARAVVSDSSRILGPSAAALASSSGLACLHLWTAISSRRSTGSCSADGAALWHQPPCSIANGPEPDSNKRWCSIYSNATGQRPHSVHRAHSAKVQSIWWSPDDATLLTCGAEGAIYRWRVAGLARLHETTLQVLPLNPATCSAAGSPRRIDACSSENMFE